MADNTTINPGAGGDSVATDDISGVKYQRVKLIHGADGFNDGDVSTVNGLPVQVLSLVVGTGATSLGKAEDAGHTSGDTGVMALAVRKDTLAALAGTDLDYIPLIVNSSGRLWTTTILEANSGVDVGDVDVTSVVPGTGASNLGKAEDAIHASADVGVMALAVRTDTPANRSGADGDYEPLQVSAGRLWTSAVVTTNVVPKSGTATLTNVNDTASSTTLLSSNSSRVGATFFNDSTSILYLKCGATASTTSFTTQIQPSGYYELPGPAIYTGVIDGIWSADSTGAVRITEFT